MSVVAVDPVDRLRVRVEELAPWFHNMDLGYGIWTAPEHYLGDYPRFKYERFAGALPVALDGRSVLDIGCNAGFYAMEMKRRGAGRVLGIDSDERYLAQARLRRTRSAFPTWSSATCRSTTSPGSASASTS